MEQVTAYSPATIANLGSGFDLLGLALNVPGDTVMARRVPEKRLTFIPDPAWPELPADHRNVSCHVAQTLFDILRPDCGVEIRLIKQIPPGSGLGGSAASSVAAACAMNWLFDNPFSKEELLPFAMEGERLASGSAHADNVAPALFGGLCLISPGDKMEVLSLPAPKKIYWIVVLPEYRCDTRGMRSLLPDQLPLTTHTCQAGYLATLLSGILTRNPEWMGRGMVDLVAEPVRAGHIPGFAEVRKAALLAGARGFGISGSGPALFAFAEKATVAAKVAAAMQEAFMSAASLDSQKYISVINTLGTVMREE